MKQKQVSGEERLLNALRLEIQHCHEEIERSRLEYVAIRKYEKQHERKDLEPEEQEKYLRQREYLEKMRHSKFDAQGYWMNQLDLMEEKLARKLIIQGASKRPEQGGSTFERMVEGFFETVKRLREPRPSAEDLDSITGITERTWRDWLKKPDFLARLFTECSTRAKGSRHSKQKESAELYRQAGLYVDEIITNLEERLAENERARALEFKDGIRNYEAEIRELVEDEVHRTGDRKTKHLSSREGTKTGEH